MLDADLAYELATIPGVTNAWPRVWGYHYFAPADLNITVMGVDPDLPHYADAFNSAITQLPPNSGLEPLDFAIIGPGLANMLSNYGFKDEFYFILS